MVGTRLLARILDHADRAGAKVVLVGDTAQLPEIDAGGAFRGLAVRLGSVRLDENRRQVHQWEREALELLRAGDAGGAIGRYWQHNRVVVRVSAPDITNLQGARPETLLNEQAQLQSGLVEGWDGVAPREFSFDGTTFRIPGRVAPQMVWDKKTNQMTLELYIGARPALGRTLGEAVRPIAR